MTGCTNGRHAVMMMTTAMLELAAGIAETKAYDEVSGADTYERYVTHVVELVRQRRRMEGVDPSLHSAPHRTDPHKLARQRHLFDQQVAFILGHELAHHYRGHTNCVEGRSPAEIEQDQLSQLLAHTVPPFSQPREVEADMWGLTNVLEAGHDRAGGRWSAEGALLNEDFFRRVSDRGGAELLLAFLSTHPPSVVRIPIVRATAQQWSEGWRPRRSRSRAGAVEAMGGAGASSCRCPAVRSACPIPASSRSTPGDSRFRFPRRNRRSPPDERGA